jgi:hypothetical protein
LAGPRPTTRAGSGLTIRKNSAAVSGGGVRDLDLIEGDGILITIAHDQKLGIARVTVTATSGPSADREVGITGADTTPSELNDKILVTAPISKAVEDAGGDEHLRISHGGQHNFTDLLGVISDAQHGTRSGDLHPIYLTTAEADALYEALGAVATHEAAGDPHAVYLTQTEADALYEVVGTMAAHEAAGDPHPGYMTPDEHTAVGDGAPHHAEESGESGTHIHDTRYPTDAEVTSEIEGSIGYHAAFPDIHHAEVHPHASHSGIGPDDHHPQSHAVASHSDTSATGVRLDAVTNGSEVDVEHRHRGTFYIPIASESEDGILIQV